MPWTITRRDKKWAVGQPGSTRAPRLFASLNEAQRFTKAKGMTTEVKQVTDAIKAVAGLKDEAKRLSGKIDDAVVRSKNAMGKVETGIVDPLLEAVTELEALTNSQTNGPPVDE